jgi:hypothetical protein
VQFSLSRCRLKSRQFFHGMTGRSDSCCRCVSHVGKPCALPIAALLIPRLTLDKRQPADCVVATAIPHGERLPLGRLVHDVFAVAYVWLPVDEVEPLPLPTSVALPLVFPSQFG